MRRAAIFEALSRLPARGGVNAGEAITKSDPARSGRTNERTAGVTEYLCVTWWWWISKSKRKEACEHGCSLEGT